MLTREQEERIRQRLIRRLEERIMGVTEPSWCTATPACPGCIGRAAGNVSTTSAPVAWYYLRLGPYFHLAS